MLKTRDERSRSSAKIVSRRTKQMHPSFAPLRIGNCRLPFSTNFRSWVEKLRENLGRLRDSPAGKRSGRRGTLLFTVKRGGAVISPRCHAASVRCSRQRARLEMHVANSPGNEAPLFCMLYYRQEVVLKRPNGCLPRNPLSNEAH